MSWHEIISCCFRLVSQSLVNLHDLWLSKIDDYNIHFLSCFNLDSLFIFSFSFSTVLSFKVCESRISFSFTSHSWCFLFSFFYWISNLFSYHFLSSNNYKEQRRRFHLGFQSTFCVLSFLEGEWD